MLTPNRLIIFDIDGLRQDVFLTALHAGRLPHLSRLLAGAVHLNPVSTAPSITFTAQTSLFTGLPPGRHGILGNRFLDRFTPRFYAFDVGDTMRTDDAVSVYTGRGGLLNEALDTSVPTLYQRAARAGWTSTVVHHMLSRGADKWIRPGIIEITRLTRSGRLFGLSPDAFDDNMVKDAIDHVEEGNRPDVLTTYFLGLDDFAQDHGPEGQADYLAEVVDGQIRRIVAALEEQDLLHGALVAVISDHGQVRVKPDARRALRLSYPFGREIAALFASLGLNVEDLPDEDEDCQAAVASNGGMAHIYLRRRDGAWFDPPRFGEDVLPVAQAFWEANETGRYSRELQGGLAMILARDVQTGGWQADYQVYTPGGLEPVDEYLDEHPEIETIEALPRLEAMAGANAGDITLVANYAGQFYFADPEEGLHGGLHPDDSLAVTSLAWIGADEDQAERLESVVAQVLAERQAVEGRRHAALTDFVPIIEAMLGWE